MIWIIEQMEAFQCAFGVAGEANRQGRDAEASQSRWLPSQRSQSDCKRYQYLLFADPRVSLCCVGIPLTEWQESALAIVRIGEIRGEFAGNIHLAKETGLQIILKRFASFEGQPEKTFETSDQALQEIARQLAHLTHRKQSRLSRYERRNTCSPSAEAAHFDWSRTAREDGQIGRAHV